MSEKKPLREILAPMSTREKINYIWYYYKALIIVIILVIGTISYIVLQSSGQKEVALNIMVVGEGLDTIQLEQIEVDLSNTVLGEEEKEKSQVLIQSVPITVTDGGGNLSVAMQRVVAEIASQSLDILFIEKGQFEMMNEEGHLYDINSLLDIELTFNNEKFYNAGNDITGIDVSVIKPFNEAILGNVIMCIPVNSPNIEHVKSFLKNIEFIK